MKRRVLLVHHSDDATDDRLYDFVVQSGFEADLRFPFRGDNLDVPIDEVAATVIYGGMYNAYDTALHPFLREEYAWLDRAMTAGVPVLGICQGAQMIAHHLGAFAGAPGHGQYEFGCYQVHPVPGASDFLAEPLWLNQAHYHTFDLPKGARHLARSEMFENQAFQLGDNVFGFQFHAEVTPAGMRRWQEAGDFLGQPGAQTPAEQNRLANLHEASQSAWFRGFLQNWLPEEAT
ncbi:MAG: glutamine amidotransferase [Pseudomonadota bacterium]